MRLPRSMKDLELGSSCRKLSQRPEFGRRCAADVDFGRIYRRSIVNAYRGHPTTGRHKNVSGVLLLPKLQFRDERWQLLSSAIHRPTIRFPRTLYHCVLHGGQRASVAPGNGVASDRTDGSAHAAASRAFRPAHVGLLLQRRCGSGWSRSGSTARGWPPWPRSTVPRARESVLSLSPDPACAYGRPARR
ncbi:hypothetical protein ABIA06_002899 [Bradyrhizobium yuanmingense]